MRALFRFCICKLGTDKRGHIGEEDREKRDVVALHIGEPWEQRREMEMREEESWEMETEGEGRA